MVSTTSTVNSDDYVSWCSVAEETKVLHMQNQSRFYTYYFIMTPAAC